MSHSGGNLYEGWQASVFPWYTSCTGKKSPVNDATNTEVIWRLSSRPPIPTLFDPHLFIVHDKAGTMLTPVWSQFSTRSGGISSIVTVALMSAKKISFIWSKSSTLTLTFVLAHLLTKSIRLRTDLPHSFESVRWPPNWQSWERLVLDTIPFAAALTNYGCVNNGTCWMNGTNVCLHLLVQMFT